MIVVVKNITRVTVGLILLFGIYISISGDSGPGGGFAGGIIIALSLIHFVLVFGKTEMFKTTDMKRVLKTLVNAVSVSGLLLLLLFCLNMFGRGTISGKALEFAFVACDVSLALFVSGSLFTMFVALSAYRVIVAKEDK